MYEKNGFVIYDYPNLKMKLWEYNFYHVITIYILSISEWFFEDITMPYYQADLLYQHAVKYYHRAENYQQSILQNITPFGLRLKNRAAINLVSPDFNSLRNGIFKGAERKLLTLLLQEAQKISESADSEFQEIIKKGNPNNYVKQKELVQKKNLKLKRILEERRKKKRHKFRKRVPAPEKRRSNNLLVSDYIENALNKTKANGTSETISKKRSKKLRRRAMEVTKSGIALLNDSNDKHSSSLYINERNQRLDSELRENQSACISLTVDSLVDLDNSSSKERDEMIRKGKETSEAQSSFNDTVLQNFDLPLLEILQSLQNLSGSVSEASNLPMTCTSTAGLINTPTGTTTVENNIRNIEENISVTQEELITRTDNNERLQGYFCSHVVFNLSHKVLTDLKISVLGK